MKAAVTRVAEPHLTDIQIYCNCMAEVRTRIGVVQGVLAGEIRTGHEICDDEIICLQLRKVLECIAFASLCANKEAYSAVHEKFASHWKAKAMLEDLKKINPDFYPVPLDPPQETAPGRKHFPRPVDGFMTTDEFVALYDYCSDALHAPNPFRSKEPDKQIPYTVEEGVCRIQRLLGWHLVHLVDGDNKWIVNIPAEGNVQAWPASPRVEAGENEL
jgi:hypothetical protein